MQRGLFFPTLYERTLAEPWQGWKNALGVDHDPNILSVAISETLCSIVFRKYSPEVAFGNHRSFD